MVDHYVPHQNGPAWCPDGSLVQRCRLASRPSIKAMDLGTINPEVLLWHGRFACYLEVPDGHTSSWYLLIILFLSLLSLLLYYSDYYSAVLLYYRL